MIKDFTKIILLAEEKPDNTEAANRGLESQFSKFNATIGESVATPIGSTRLRKALNTLGTGLEAKV